MRAPPTPGSLSLSSYNLNDNLGMHDAYNSQASSTGQPTRNTDSYKTTYSYSDGVENIAYAGAVSGYSENMDMAYNSSLKYNHQSLTSTSSIPTAPTEPITISSLNTSSMPKKSSYIVSIHFLKMASLQLLILIMVIKSANDEKAKEWKMVQS